MYKSGFGRPFASRNSISHQDKQETTILLKKQSAINLPTQIRNQQQEISAKRNRRESNQTAVIQ